MDSFDNVDTFLDIFENDPKVMFIRGYMYYKSGDENSKSLAVQYFKQLAENKNVEAMIKYANMLRNGIEKDIYINNYVYLLEQNEFFSNKTDFI